MRTAGLVILFSLSGMTASAQGLSTDDIVRRLTPPSDVASPGAPTAASPGVGEVRTRSLNIGSRAGSPRPIPPTTSEPVRVVHGQEDKLLAELKERQLPSLDIRVSFANNSDRLTPEGVRTLAPLGDALRKTEMQGYRFLIAGHTDARGAAGHNQSLSERRAAAVRGHLLREFGLQPRQLEAIGFGRRKPFDGTSPDDGANRRVEVINLVK